MIRGVNCALASWTATSTAEEIRATKVKVEAATVLIIARAVSGLMFICDPTARSYRVSNDTVIKAAGMLSAGRIQIELRKYERRRYR